MPLNNTDNTSLIELHQKPGLRFTWREFSGSLADLGTFLPLAILLSVLCGLDLGVILLAAGLMNVLSGCVFRQPITVQPMKAIAAIAIHESLSAGAIAAAGLIMGAMVIVLAFSGGATWVGRLVPKAIVRGIQLGIGLKLVFKAGEFLFGIRVSGTELAWHTGAGLPLSGWDSLIVAGAAVALFAVPWLRRLPMLLIVFLCGFGLLALEHPAAFDAVRFAAPRIGLMLPTAAEWRSGLISGAIPQLPLTLLNSVIAVCALSADYYPGRGISTRRMAASVGVMNLVCVPFGGMPMCHGAGGLAALYKFGARSGGAVAMLGGVMAVIGVALGSSLVELLAAYPRSILAVMLLLAGYSLGKAARDSLHGASALIVLATGFGALLFSALIGFLLGLALVIVLTLAGNHEVAQGMAPKHPA